ncbi:UDP-N-acetylglucosamine 2-epimerase (non-hydrolyzing) [Rathayibacter sp. YIM 133350]|uniref:non-hydrolyzing UDP-N-acetylglucosamine 2-epimerase n=1 Tax=Rathayibacter sp. YIM 133350 TaxID=3131992 RepID=UPI00307E22C7
MADERRPESGATIVLVVGTRPEAIKMLPLIIAFRADERFRAVVISTGQHSKMVADVFAMANIVPDVTLYATTPGMSLNALFASVMTGVQRFIQGAFGEPRGAELGVAPSGYPTAMFVHGDTSSAAASAVAAFHMRIPVVHVEAGLRTSDILSPYPEEFNRQVISRIAALHLAPTAQNAANLEHEGIDRGRIFICGNTAIDALKLAAQVHPDFADPRLQKLHEDHSTRVVLVTTHRRENWGAGIRRIATAVEQLSDAYPDVHFVVSVHPNPEVGAILTEVLDGRDNVILTAPLPYGQFAHLIDRSYFAISDSGGIQEEAPALGTPVLVAREETERQEGVAAGTVELVGTQVERIVDAASRLLDSPDLRNERAGRLNPYGDGESAERIVAAAAHVAFGSPAPAPFGPPFDRHKVLVAGGYSVDPASLLAFMADLTTPAEERIDSSRMVSDLQ